MYIPCSTTSLKQVHNLKKGGDVGGNAKGIYYIYGVFSLEYEACWHHGNWRYQQKRTCMTHETGLLFLTRTFDLTFAQYPYFNL